MVEWGGVRVEKLTKFRGVSRISLVDKVFASKEVH